MSPILATMLDSISISRPITLVEQKTIRGNLRQKEESVDINTGEVSVKGKVGEVITVYVRGNHLQVWGSLSQFYTGSKVLSLRWGQVSKAFEKLEGKLGVDLNSSYFSRLDMEATMLLPHETKNYFSYLGEHKHYNRFRDNTTLYYSNSSRQICIYDKGMALEPSGRIGIPEGQSLMRFEVRYKNRYLKQLAQKNGMHRISVANILDPAFQKTLTIQWLSEYDSIPKHPKLQLNFEGIQGVKELKQGLEAHAIECLGGSHEVINMIERARATNPQLDRKIVSKLKSAIRSYSQRPSITLESPLIDELTTSITKASIDNLLSINETY